MAKLKNDPGAAFHYSNAGVAHLVLLFHRAAGEDLFPFLKRRLFEPIGETQLRWTQIGGRRRGRSGRSARATAASSPTPASTRGSATWRCTRGSGPASGSCRRRTTTSPGRGPRSRPTTAASGGPHPHVPARLSDLVMTLGRNHNDGFVVPSLDLVFVRLGDGDQFPEELRERPGSQGPGGGGEVARAGR